MSREPFAGRTPATMPIQKDADTPTRMVGFDESGNTGSDLMNEEQPVFALASVGISDTSAQSLLPSDQPEFHFVKATRSARGRQEIIRLLGSDLLTPEVVKVVVIDKKLMACSKIVDLLIEEPLHRSGIDLYSNGSHIELAHGLYSLVLQGVDGALEMVGSFISLVRDFNSDSAQAFADSLNALRLRTDPAFESVFALMLSEIPVVSRTIHLEQKQPLSMLDPTIPSFVDLAQEWGTSYPAINVLHDESGVMQKCIPVLKELWDQTKPPVSIRLSNGMTSAFPLPVESFRFTESQNSALVQLADLVSGATRVLFGSMLSGAKPTRFETELGNTPLRDWLSGGSIWAIQGTKVNRRESTPFQANVMAKWLAS